MKRLAIALCTWLCAAGASAAELRAGLPLESALAALNERGARIVYSNALVTPDMTLRTAPQAAGLAAQLEEILAPWGLRAVQAENGDWLVVVRPLASDLISDDFLDIETVDVTASRFALATADAGAVFLDRAAVERMPHLADDAVRMLKVLPGVSGGDFSAALNVRGGRRDETRLTIDGAEIHNGFHFRDLTGALSVLDTNLVESIDFVTGGMTAEHGDYMSGVVNLATRRPREDDAYRSAVGVSFVSAYGRSGGTFAAGRGAWLASARRGYLDVIMERVQGADEQITPRYTDVFASLYYDFTDDTRIAVHALYGEDNLKLITRDDDDIDSAGRGSAMHLWTTLDHAFGDSLTVRTLLSASTAEQTRDSAGEDDRRYGAVVADFEFDFLDLQQDWSWTLGERHLVRWGVSANRTEASYDYALDAGIFDPRVPGGIEDVSHQNDVDARGDRLGAYASWRLRVLDPLTMEIGTRWDRYTYPGQEHDAVSPRINAVYSLSENDDLRAAWSVLHQPQGIDQLAIEDDDETFYRPERVQAAVLGYTRRFDHGLSARVDIYRKQYTRLRPRYENALDPVQLIPEGAVDRIRIDAPEAEARGIELTLRREAQQGFSGWFSVSRSEARDRDVASGWTPRLWEQRTAFSFGASWVGSKWNASLAGLYHSGTPITDLTVETVPQPGGGEAPALVIGARNRAQLGDYSRVDLRVSRDVQLASSRLAFYFEVTNLFDRKNPCCVEDYELRFSSGGQVSLVPEITDWLPMLPSLGFQYEF